MIYEINSGSVYQAIQMGAQLVVNSADGASSLVESDLPLDGVGVIVQYSQSERSMLIGLPKWKQPCLNC